MRTVRIDKKELLKTVTENRKNHRAIFEESFKKYAEQAVAEFQQLLQEAKLGRHFNRSLTLIEPVDMTREYDKIVKQLEMSRDEIIELTDQEFSMYVMDQWAWRAQFLTSNAMYSARADTLAKAEGY